MNSDGIMVVPSGVDGGKLNTDNLLSACLKQTLLDSCTVRKRIAEYYVWKV